MRYKIAKFVCKVRQIIKKGDGFGMNEVLGVAAALIIAAFIIIPQLRNFATNIMTQLSTWWTNISNVIFPAA